MGDERENEQKARMSGRIPQIMIIAGSCAGLAAYSPGIADFVFMIPGHSQMFVTGPKVIREVTGEQCTLEGLGIVISDIDFVCVFGSIGKLRRIELRI